MSRSQRLNPFEPFIHNPRYASIAWVFMIHGLPLSTWIVYIPWVKEKLSLTEGELGIGLFCYAMGAFIMMPLSSVFIRKWGDGKTTLYSTLVMCILFVLPLGAPTYLLLCISLFITGAFGGLMDISMNATASVLEKNATQYIMSGCHGFFSLGAMIGSGLGSLIASTGISPVYHMLLLNLLLIISQIPVAKHYIKIRESQASSSRRPKLVIAPLIGLSAIAMAFMMAEGAIHDWSTVYMKEVVQTSTVLVGLGFAGFSFTMSIGRFYGDPIQEKLNLRQIILLGGITALGGLGLILTTQLLWVVLGFTLVGLGLSGMVPVLFRAASKVENLSGAQGIATVAGVGYMGFLIGPVILGLIAEYSSLRLSFACVILLVLIAIFLALRVIKPE